MHKKIELIQGDITEIEVDAIVNAANSSLLGGGGVDGAIHRKGGKVILEECKKIREAQGGCPTGDAVITTGGNLPAKYVIHTVGPVWQGGNSKEKQLLGNAYFNSLSIAEKRKFYSIAFPNISTGVYDYPKRDAAIVAVESVKDFMPNNTYPEKVIFVCFDNENFLIYQNLLNL